MIKGYGADTFYPSIDKNNIMFSGYDDGGVDNVGVNSAAPDFQTGSAIVSGYDIHQPVADWRNLTSRQVGGAQFEDGGKRLGRYTSAVFVQNGTWWIGTYGGDEGDNACTVGSGVPQLCTIMPFVGFRYSTDLGLTWTPTPSSLSVELGLFGETGDSAVKFGMPHIVDHGKENENSPDSHLYMVGTGCMAASANSNCSWISGDAIFLLRAKNVAEFSSNPEMMNDKSNWEYWCGNDDNDDDKWCTNVEESKPVFEWHGHVGTVTATYNVELKKYIFAGEQRAKRASLEEDERSEQQAKRASHNLFSVWCCWRATIKLILRYSAQFVFVAQ